MINPPNFLRTITDTVTGKSTRYLNFHFNISFSLNNISTVSVFWARHKFEVPNQSPLLLNYILSFSLTQYSLVSSWLGRYVLKELIKPPNFLQTITITGNFITALNVLLFNKSVHVCVCLCVCEWKMKTAWVKWCGFYFLLSFPPSANLTNIPQFIYRTLSL